MHEIADFASTEMWTVETTLKERYGREVPLEQADIELRLRPGATELTVCPALYWQERGAHFVVVKTGESRYRAQFYYRAHEMYGTGVEEYEDLGECVVTLLRVQADHEAQRQTSDPS